MTYDLLAAVQQNLGYPLLQKMDPNTQQVIIDEAKPAEDKFSQAAIPAILTALYKYVQSDEGATEFLQSNNPLEWVNRIFHEHKKEAIETIAAYARQSNEDPVVKINEIANEAVRLVKENLPATAGIKEVKKFMSKQRSHILLYLPAALHMGELLNDNSLDDNTNKMEGPVSSLIQSIGSVFSSPVTADEIKK